MFETTNQYRKHTLHVPFVPLSWQELNHETSGSGTKYRGKANDEPPIWLILVVYRCLSGAFLGCF